MRQKKFYEKVDNQNETKQSYVWNKGNGKFLFAIAAISFLFFDIKYPT